MIWTEILQDSQMFQWNFEQKGLHQDYKTCKPFQNELKDGNLGLNMVHVKFEL